MPKRINTEYDIVMAFEAIEEELIASMMNNLDRHRAEELKEGYNWSQWQVEQLASLEEYKHHNKKKYGSQFKDINRVIDMLISQQREAGNASQEIAILNAIKKGLKAHKSAPGVMGEFFKVNDRKMDALIEATKNDLEKAEHAMLRRADDQYRQVIYNAQTYAASGATYEKAVDMATRDFLAAGIACVEYKNGSRHKLSDYADMCLRTANKRAYLTGEGEKRKEWGISTVIMNKRGNPCPKCLPFVGRVLIDDVWSGGTASDGRYPLMSNAMAAGLYHPRCKDSHTTYFEDISDEPDNKWTKEELEQIERGAKLEAGQQYAKRQEEKCERLSKYSLDPENKRLYEARAEQWKTKQLQEMDIEELRKIAKNEAVKYYKSGKSHISFGNTSPEDAAEMLVAQGSKTSLIKDIKSMQKKNAVDNIGKSDIIKADKDLSKYIGKEIKDGSNQGVREWYYANVHDIPNQIDKSKSFDEQVKQAYELRNKYKKEARVAMSDTETVELLEKKKPVKSFEELLDDKMQRKNLTKEEALKDILETASKTNNDVDTEFGL